MATDLTVPAQRVSGKRKSAAVTHDTAGRLDARLLDALTEHIQDRYSGLTDDEYLILAIWIIHTYFYTALGITPYLHIASLGPNAGKSTLGEIIRDLAYQAESIYPTVTALTQFRETDKHTLIIDQFDTLLSSRSTDVPYLYSVLNNGYKPSIDGARVSGQTDRDLFFPKAVIGIGPNILEAALKSRSITVMALPGTEADQRERNRRQTLRPVSGSVAALSARLGHIIKPAVNAAIIADMLPSCERTQLLNDGTMIINRDQEIWRVMITIADLFGPDCGKRMRDIVAGRINAEPEYLPSAAEIVDGKLKALMREKKLTAVNWEDGREPLQGQPGYPMTDDDFGYPAPRNGQRGKLPTVTLWRKPGLRQAELRIRTGKDARDFDEISAALGMIPSEVRHIYRDAGRLNPDSGKPSIQMMFREGQGKVSLVGINVSGWLWPEETATER